MIRASNKFHPVLRGCLYVAAVACGFMNVGWWTVGPLATVLLWSFWHEDRMKASGQLPPPVVH